MLPNKFLWLNIESEEKKFSLYQMVFSDGLCGEEVSDDGNN